MGHQAATHWIFGPFELVPERGWLVKNGVTVTISPKPLGLLACLIERQPDVISRAELLELVWPDVSVSESAFLSAVRDLRRALGDDAGQPQFIETVRGQGLRFCQTAHALPKIGRLPDAGAPSAVWETAALNLERALDALGAVDRARGTPSDARSRGEIQIALGRAQWAAGKRGPAREAFSGAAADARREGHTDTLALCALGYAGRTDATLGVDGDAVQLLEEAAQALPSSDTALRAEVLARLGTELYYDADPSRSQELTREAVAIAERLEDPTILAYALTARHYTSHRPDVEPADRLHLTLRAVEALREEPASETTAISLQDQVVDQLEIGDGKAARTALAEFAKSTEAIDQPFFGWLHSAFEGHLAFLEGRLDEAEQLAEESFERGRAIESPNALPVFVGQLFTLRREQKREAELIPLLASEADRNEQIPLFRAGLAALQASAGDAEPARETLGSFLQLGTSALPPDLLWLPTVTMLASAAADLKDEDHIRALEDVLAPFSDRIVLMGYGTASLGSVSHHRGRLAAARGANQEALAHFEQAETIHERLGSSTWSEQTRLARLAL